MQSQHTSRWRRRTMMSRSTLIAAIVAFVTIQAALAWFLQRGRADWRDPAFGARVRDFERRIDSHRTPPRTVVMLGSSLTLAAVHGCQLEEELSRRTSEPWEACNLGHPGAGPVSQLLSLRRLLRAGIKPDLVLLEFFPAHLRGNGKPGDLTRWPAHLLSRRDLTLLSRYGAADLERAWWESNVVPAYGHRRAIINRLAPFLVPQPEREYVYATLPHHGWCGMPDVDARKLIASRDKPRQVFADGLRSFDPCPLTATALEEMLTLLRRHRIPCILVWMPEGPGMQTLYSQETLDRMSSLLRELQARHEMGLINGRDWMPEAGFCDSYHLSRTGARLFTPRLAEAVATLR